MKARPRRFAARFDGRHVLIECQSDALARTLARQLAHVVTPGRVGQALLDITFEDPAPSWIEVRDSTGRIEAGSLEHAVHHARKWITAAFVGAAPDLTWLHAAAAARAGRAVLLAGAAGAGKSTLLLHLLEREWLLLADDAVAIEPGRRQALPLPFSPERRETPCRTGDDWPAFLAQPKTLATIEPRRVASAPAVVGAIVFPEYCRGASRPRLAPLSVVSATQALVSQSLLPGRPGRRSLGSLFELARHVPCYRLRYADGPAAADVLVTLEAASPRA